MAKLILWNIYVPTHDNEGKKFEDEYHKKWDAFVQKITKGLTIQKISKGIWINPTDRKYEENVIPVKIACTKNQIEIIADYTAEHYGQEAIMYYIVSKDVFIINYDTKLNFKRKTI